MHFSCILIGMNDQGRIKSLLRDWTERLTARAQPARVKDDLTFSSGGLTLRKSADNRYFLLCSYSNKYRDIDSASAPHKGGEIISDAAHRKFMAYLDSHPDQAPELWSLHVPGTARERKAHWWDYDGTFSYVEFELTQKEATKIALFAKKYTPGLSHGFEVLQYDQDNAVIEEYITHEVSILPLEWAANPWTTIEMIKKEYTMKFTPEKRAALVELHDEEFVTAAEANAKTREDLLEAVGLDKKNLSFVEDEAAENAAETTVTTSVSEQDFIAALNAMNIVHNDDIKALNEAYTKQIGDLTQRIEALEDRLGEYEDEETVAKAAALPPSVLATWRPQSAIGQMQARVAAGDSRGTRKGTPAGQKNGQEHNGHMLGGLISSLYNGEEETDE